MRVPFLDLGRLHAPVREELLQAIAAVVDGCQFVLGPAVERFEHAFARYLGVEYCVGVNNGTSALHLALQACDIGPGDEVITTPHSWISTTWAISYVGARPVFVDIDPASYNIDAAQIEAAITPRTKAILPVHLYGQAADLPALADIARRRGLWLIEDAAQAHGAQVNARRVGGWGHVGCFSFYPGKNLGACGEGGAVVTHDEDLAARLRCLRDHAQRTRHEHVELGYNYRMEGIQGAALEVKLRRLDAWNAERTRCAARYRELLADVPGLVLPSCVDPLAHVWHLFVVQLVGRDRDEVRERLAQQGVGTAVHYPTLIPLQPAYRHLGHAPADFPVAEAVARRCLSLPMFPGLTDKEITYTCDVLRGVLQEAPIPRPHFLSRPGVRNVAASQPAGDRASQPMATAHESNQARRPPGSRSPASPPPGNSGENR